MNMARIAGIYFDMKSKPNLLRQRRAVTQPAIVHIKWQTAPDAVALERRLDCMRTLLRQMQLARADVGKFDRLYVTAQEELTRAYRALPHASVKQPKKLLPIPPPVAHMEQSEEVITHEFDPLSLLVRHKGWVRFMDPEELGVRPQFTHKIMPGTYHLLASDGIRGIVSPADAPQRREVIVHMTNLTVVPLPPGPKKEKVAKEPKVKVKKVPVYNIDDLV